MNSDVRRLSLMASLLLLVLPAAIAKAQEIPGLTVCDVLADPQKWSDTFVAMRGELVFGAGPFHGTYAMVGRNCPVVPETNGEKWLPSVNLVKASSIAAGDANRASVDPLAKRVLDDVTNAIIRNYQEQLGKTLEQPPFRVTVTFVGTLRSRKLDFLARAGTQRTLIGSGFGESGVYPAQMEYLGVRDIVIIQQSHVPSSEPNAP